tara:strand:- start:3215 stop:4066 length:852 start_codon:yes stop_codon:yes gene_type:complete
MKVMEFVKEITEVQKDGFLLFLSQDEYDKFERTMPLIWMWIKRIQEFEIIRPLEKLSESFTEITLRNGRSNTKNNFRSPEFFYSTCIQHIPKKKYKFINIKPQKKKNYDYEFIKLLAKDTKEGTKNCEEYLDIYEHLGILEEERKNLFNKYGRYNLNNEENTGKPLKSSCKNEMIKYENELNRVKNLPIKKRKKLLKGTNLRKYIFNVTGVSQTQYSRLKYIRDNSLDGLDRIDSGETTVRQLYHELKGIDTSTSEIEKFEKHARKLSEKISKEKMIDIIKKL